jgi:uncharacterized protein YdeI (YjbR/CyaY-like superfamily)
MKPTFFATPHEFRSWLERHHETETELLVGFYKKSSGRPSITWPESVDEALCFGWIDGIRRSIDEEAYCIRFTPRRKGSTWSAVNLRKVDELIRAQRMRPAGLRAYETRDPEKSAPYSFERGEEPSLGPELEGLFKAHPAAWTFFESQPPGYRKTATSWILSAKRDETRQRRLRTLIEDSAAGQRLGMLRRPGDVAPADPDGDADQP